MGAPEGYLGSKASSRRRAQVGHRILFAVTTHMSIDLLGSLPKRLVSEGLEVHLVSNMDGDDSLSVSPPGLFSHHLTMVRTPAPFRDLIAIFAAIVLIARIGPTTVIAGTPKAALIFMLASFVMKVPNRVYFLLGLRLETTRGIFNRFLWVAEKVTASAATHVLSVSQSLRQKFIASRLSRKEKVVVIGHGSSKGVDLARFRPPKRGERPDLDSLRRRIGLAPDIPTVGFFGRIARDKGINVLNEARVLLARSGIDHQLLVVGPNETVRSHPLATHPTLRPPVVLGQIPDLSSLYRLLDVLCLPTFREGLPNVCLEASASGVAVVTTATTGAIDSIENGVTGLLVNPGSSEELANALGLVLTKPGLRKKLAGEGRRWVGARFDAKTVEDQYVFFLNGLLEDTPNCRDFPPHTSHEV
jgi:glycosyltransferase involved in cell wall biosynthesis